MSKVGFQDYWVVGGRFYFKLEDQAGVEQELVDIGTIDSATPTAETTKAELFDADGGLRRLVDTAIVAFSETWDLVVRNMNLDNLAVLFQANAPASFTQSAAEASISHWLVPGKLFKVKDALGVYLFGLATIAGVYTGSVSTKPLPSTGTVVNKTAKTIVLTGDQSAVAGLAPGKAFILNAASLTNIKNSRTYTVVTNVFTTVTTLTVLEAPDSDETTIVGATITHENAGTIKKQGIDWEPVSTDRGIGRVIDGGSIVAAAAYTVVYSTKSITGKRLVNPQSFTGVRKGTGFIFLGRSNNADQTVREALITLTPNGSPSLPTDDFASMPLQATVLSDVTATVPAGRLLQAIGTLPTKMS